MRVNSDRIRFCPSIIQTKEIKGINRYTLLHNIYCKIGRRSLIEGGADSLVRIFYYCPFKREIKIRGSREGDIAVWSACCSGNTLQMAVL